MADEFEEAESDAQGAPAELGPVTKFNSTDLLLDVFEKRKQLLIFGCVLSFDSPAPGMDAIASDIEKWIKMYPTLMCRREGDNWVQDPAYHQARHVRYIQMPPGSDLPEVERVVSTQMSRPFSSRKPHWRAFYLDGLVSGRGALIFLVDHRLTDTEGFMRLLINVTSTSVEERMAKLSMSRSRSGTVSETQASPNDSTSSSIPSTPTKPVFETPPRLRSTSFFDFNRRDRIKNNNFEPSSPIISLQPGTISTGSSVVEDDTSQANKSDEDDLEDDISLASMGPNSSSGSPFASPQTPRSNVSPLLRWAGKYTKILFGKRKIFSKAGSIKKETVFNELLDLAEVRATGKVVNASVNDVMLSCLAGAIRVCAELKSPGITQSETDARVFIPISTRAADDWELSNKLCATINLLPLNISDPLERLIEVNKRQNDVKNSLEANINNFISKNATRLPKSILRPLFSKLKRNIHVVYNNLMLLSPQSEIVVAGSPVKAFHFPFPQINETGGLGVSVVSYNGLISMSLTNDLGEFEPSGLVFLQAFNREYAELKHKILTTGPRFAFSKP